MRWLRAPAKINLSLRVLARRSDGLHEIESLVAFAGICDWLGYEPGRSLELDVEGPTALEAGPPEKNLVLRAARALAARVPGLTLGRFRLVKRLPAAAGIGGGCYREHSGTHRLPSQTTLEDAVESRHDAFRRHASHRARRFRHHL